MTDAVADDPFAYTDQWCGIAIQANDWHFHRRLYERYSVVLRPGDYSKIIRMIRSGEAMRVRTDAKGMIYFVPMFWWTEKPSPRLFLLYHPKAGLVTAWPPSREIRAKRAEIRAKIAEKREQRRLKREAAALLPAEDPAPCPKSFA